MDGRSWNTGSQPPVAPPQQDSPFEEPEQAPELYQHRSENLYTRDEPFWNRVVEEPQGNQSSAQDANYWNHPDVMKADTLRQVETKTQRQKTMKASWGRMAVLLLIIVAVITLIVAVMNSPLFSVRRIIVLGNTTVPGQDIVRLSGIKIGDNYTRIDDEEVMRKIEANPYLRCTLVDVKYGSVTIYIKEREPAAYIKHNGLMIKMDNRGYVLAESLSVGTEWDPLVRVTGLDVRRSAIGQTISLNNGIQLDVYTKILVELKAMNALHLLRELDMSSMDSIYLATSDAYFSSLETEEQKARRKIIYARLGNEESIHEKLRAFLITRQRVLELGHTSGTIDVTDPARPSYSPN